VETFASDPELRRRAYDVCFGHEASARVTDAVTRRLGVHEAAFVSHRRFGNTVSASVPLGMSVAVQEGRLRRGDRVLVIMGSAGMSIGFCAFTF
jgi:3-oxoacyl-[acyl-carrier-protein] synthase-3